MFTRKKKGPKMFTAKEARSMLGLALSAEAKADPDRATERQAAALAKFGIDQADKLSFTEASDLMTALVDRIKADLCSLRQMSWLVERGAPVEQARQTPFKDASTFIEESRSW